MRTLITGISGQDGSYLADLLLAEGHEVHGIVRRVAGAPDPHAARSRIRDILPRISLHHGDVQSLPSISEIVRAVQPDEVYHLAAQSHVAVSFEDPYGTSATIYDGTHHLLTALRTHAPGARLYNAATSEMFGAVSEVPQTETTPFYPRSPYAVAKVAAFHLVRLWREAYSLFFCSGIMFNHESPRRGRDFVTRKIARGAVRIAAGQEKELRLGNLEARRDWGHAKDYVMAMPLMLRHSTPDDYVIATGEDHSVRDFCRAAFARVGLDYRQYVVVDPAFIRPAEVDVLRGDATKARTVLGWQPTESFSELVDDLVQHEQRELERETLR